MTYEERRPRPRTSETQIRSFRDACVPVRRHAHAAKRSATPQRKSGVPSDSCPVRARASAAPCVSRPRPANASTTPRRDRPAGAVTGVVALSGSGGSCRMSTASRGSIATSPRSGRNLL